MLEALGETAGGLEVSFDSGAKGADGVLLGEELGSAFGEAGGVSFAIGLASEAGALFSGSVTFDSGWEGEEINGLLLLETSVGAGVKVGLSVRPLNNPKVSKGILTGSALNVGCTE